MTIWKTLLLSLAAMSVWKSTSAVHSINFAVEEEVQEGYLIGNVISGAGLDTKYNQTVLNRLKYTLLTQGNHRDLFSLGERDGELRTARRLDRDTICLGLEVCDVQLDIAIQPVQYFQAFKVIVKIEDINDNDPTFPTQIMKAEISENGVPGAMLSIPIASDPDSPEFSINRYELSSVSGIFELQVTNSTDGTAELNLVLKEMLEREKKERFEMRVTAYDGGNPPRTGSMEIEISVIEGPKFLSAPYSVNVHENTPININIRTVITAVFPDAGRNREVEYAFAPMTLRDYGDTFSIDPITGEIFLTGPLDYNIINQYHLTVEARAKGIVSFPISAEVTVNVWHVPGFNDYVSISNQVCVGYVSLLVCLLVYFAM